MEMMKGWKTFVFGAAIAVLGFAEQFDWTTVLETKWVGFVTAGIGFVIMALRGMTDTPMFSRGK